MTKDDPNTINIQLVVYSDDEKEQSSENSGEIVLTNIKKIDLKQKLKNIDNKIKTFTFWESRIQSYMLLHEKSEIQLKDLENIQTVLF